MTRHPRLGAVERSAGFNVVKDSVADVCVEHEVKRVDFTSCVSTDRKAMIASFGF